MSYETEKPTVTREAGREEFEKVMRRIRPNFSLVMNTEKTYYLNHNTGNMWEAWQRGQQALLEFQREAQKLLNN